jgi:hypothetical protein
MATSIRPSPRARAGLLGRPQRRRGPAQKASPLLEKL